MMLGFELDAAATDILEAIALQAMAIGANIAMESAAMASRATLTRIEREATDGDMYR
jgi:hypothetical protein